MRKNLIKTTVGLAMLALPLQARADTPSLAAFISTTQFFSPGATFDVQFLYGVQAQSSSLWYAVGTGSTTFTQILRTTGFFPNETITPVEGTRFNGNIAAAGQLVTFALCNGNGLANGTVTSNLAATCTQAPGPLYSGTGSTNVAVTSRASWNGIRTTLNIAQPFQGGPQCVPVAAAGYGCPSDADLGTVFGFEDRTTGSDNDFSDVVFSTNLSTSVPEPSTVLLTSAGLLGLVGAARRRNSKA